MINVNKFFNGLNIVPRSDGSTAPSSQGDLAVSSVDGLLYYNNGSTSSALVTAAGSATITNKLIIVSGTGANSFVDGTDNTKVLLFNNAGATTGTTLTLADLQTTSQTLNFPNIAATDTLVAAATAATLTNKTISGSSNTLSNISLTSSVTGILPLANGGTGLNAASQSALFNSLNPMTTTGDLIYEVSNGVAGRLAIGSSNQVLTVSGGVPTWAPAPAGFVNPMTSVGDMIVGGASGAATRLAATTNGYILTLVSGTPAWVANSGGAAPTSIGALDGQSPNAMGLTIASNVLYAQSASATVPGMVNTGTQSFAGSKTFNSSITSPGLIMGQIATPATPSAGFDDLYFKSDGNLYSLNSSGIENLIGGSSGTSSSYVSAYGQIGQGSTNTAVLRYGSNTVVGSDITYASSSVNGDSFTIVNTGTYALSSTILQSAGYAAALTRNCVQLNIDPNSISDGSVVSLKIDADAYYNLNTVMSLTAGDVIRVQVNPSNTSTGSSFGQFRIIRVGALSGAGSGVSSLNSLTGALTIAAGTGITVTPSGGNTLTIAATGASGANTALSNLASVAINTDLLPASDNTINLGSNTLRYAITYTEFIDSGLAALNIITDNQAAGSSNTGALLINSGSLSGSATGASGALTISSGAITNASSSSNTGNVTIKSSNNNGSGFSGNVSLTTGTTSSGGSNSGSVAISTGSASNALSISGGVSLVTGNNSAGTSGDITINSGTATGAGKVSGNITLTPGAIAGGATQGNIVLNAQTQIGATSTTLQHILNTQLATNGSGVGTFSNLPSGASGNPTGYISITINGSVRFLPFW